MDTNLFEMDNIYRKLPKQLEITLRNFIAENTLNSWTVQGNSNVTSITLRFHMDTTDTALDNTHSKFRCVPPSTLNRDRQRASQNHSALLHYPHSHPPPPQRLGHVERILSKQMILRSIIKVNKV